MKNSIIKKADILLPYFSRIPSKMQSYAIIACDQYTSEGGYWEKAKDIRAGEFSALDLILPEIYLDSTEERVPFINDMMLKYEKDVYVKYPDAMIYVERTIPKSGKIRRGIVAAADLEHYDFSVGSQSRIRATEGTVTERIPPRVKVREGAALELPHVMVFFNDPECEVFGAIEKMKGDFTLLYDFDLMQASGNIKGYLMTEEAVKVLDEATLKAEEAASLVFAVGDGNHSLATAKTCYEALKREHGDAALSMPARYALCEFVNIHDESIEFEPIYRTVSPVGADEFISAMSEKLEVTDTVPECPYFEYTIHSIDGERKIYVKNPKATLEVAVLQDLLDGYIKETGKHTDYIHGLDSLGELCKAEGVLGISFKGMEKSDLFSAVEKDGALPRKTFSMGEALDKRFYIEARRIK